jgi:hypothetical protein
MHAKRQHICGEGSKDNNIQKKNEPASRNTLEQEDSAAAINHQAHGSQRDTDEMKASEKLLIANAKL